MWATFCTSEDCILTSFKKPPSPVGQALLTLKLVFLYCYKRIARSCRRTYQRITQNRVHAGAVLAISGTLFLLLILALRTTPVTFADGEQEKIALVLNTYIYPDTLQANSDTGLANIGLKGQNLGGPTTSDAPQAPLSTVTVVAGDTLGSIAEKYGLSSHDFMVVNPGLTTMIKPGMVLNIPADAASPAEIAKIDAQIKTKAQTQKTTKTVSSGVAWPLRGSISNYFGEVSSVDPKGHTGVDIVAHYGTPIKAAASGYVTLAGTGNHGGYGTWIVIKGETTSQLYAHLSAYNVEPGDYVNQGEVIGKVGLTGNTTGAHLHFEVRVNGNPVNPLKYLP